MILNKNTDYAIRVLGIMANDIEATYTAEGLSKALRIPHTFLRSIMQKLQKGGLLTSTKGKGGGFKLAKMPAEIVLLDVVNIFQGGVSLRRCTYKGRHCAREHYCIVKAEFEKYEEYIATNLKGVTIQKLSEEDARHMMESH